MEDSVAWNKTKELFGDDAVNVRSTDGFKIMDGHGKLLGIGGSWEAAFKDAKRRQK